jgi:hypothetical protein
MKTGVICFFDISLNSFYNEKYFRQNLQSKLNTHFIFNKIFSPENRAVYEIMWKNMVQPDRPQMTIQYGACALYAG